MGYEPLQLTFDRLRRRAEAEKVRGEEIIIFDPWARPTTLGMALKDRDLNLRAMTPKNKKARKLDRQDRIIYKSPVVQLRRHRRCPLLGKINKQRRAALNLGWLCTAIPLSHRATLTQPAIERYNDLRSERQAFHNRTHHLLDGSVTIAVVNPRSLLVTVRRRDGYLPAAASVQLTGSRKGSVKGCMQRSLEGRLVSYLGPKEQIAIALANLYAILTIKNAESGQPLIVDHLRNAADYMDGTLKSYDLAGAPHSDEARYYAALYRAPVDGVRLQPSYAMPLKGLAIKSRKLAAT